MKKRLFAFFIAIIITASSFIIPTASAESVTKKIKIGYMDYAGFIDKDDNNNFSGYGVDYLNEISKYTHWEYEYVYDTWTNLLQKLKTGEIDFVGTAQYTSEREKTYDYANLSTGIETSLMYVRKDDDRFYYNDYKAFNGIKVGMLKDSFQNITFADYAKDNNFTYSSAEYVSDTQIFDALYKGEIDAAITGSLSMHKGTKNVAKFSADPFYFMTANGRTDVLNPLNNAITSIKTEKPYFEADLYQKYYGKSSSESDPPFTREEVEYIKSSGALKIGIIPNRHPLSDYDKKTGKISGITVDILSMISKISGLKFDVQPIELGKKPVLALKEGEFDLVAGIIRNDNFLQDSELALTNSIFTSSVSAVGRKGESYQLNSNLTIVMTSAFEAMEEYIKKNYPYYKIIYRTNNDECLAALSSKEADLMFQNSYVISYWLQNPRFHDLEIIPTYYIEEQTCIASLSSADPLLVSILNKSIDTLDSEEVERSIVNNTTANPYKSTLVDIYYKYKTPVLVIAALVIVCLFLAMVILIIHHKNLVRLKMKNQQLTDAINLANKASSAKSSFLARMSHEIRTPMNAIIGMTALAEKNIDDTAKISDYLNKISLSSKMLLSLINDILDMSAIENQKLKIATNAFDFKQLISSVTTIYYSQCKDKGINFDVLVSDVSEESLIGDQLRVNQILLNLLSNAVKFTERGDSIKLKIKQLSIEDKKVYMQFVVEDTGCGMSEDMLSRMFEPFEQESSSTAGKHGGSGLGMSITKNLVDLMDGAITVESEKGKGTVFTVQLPFERAKQSVSLQKERFSSIRALIVDDDVVSGEYVSNLLERIGVRHDFVSNGNEAVEMMKTASNLGQNYDICFVDWKMSEMSGAEVTRKIRELFDKDTVIIIVSAYDLSEVEDEAKAAGADMFIPKPMFQSTVFNVLMSLSKDNSAASGQPEDNYNFSGYRVLLAEDNELNLEIAKELLGLTGLEIDTVRNGKDAVDKFEASEPGTYDAILMDIQMPVMDGYEATRQIRHSSHKEAKTIPILAMTANAFTEDITTALAYGMNDHIAKPIDTVTLYSTLNKYFS